mgnify:CR=1 FL=1
MRALGFILLAGLAASSPAWADKDHHGGPGPGHGHLGPPPPLEPLPFGRDPYPSTYKPLPRVDTAIVHATVLDGAGHRYEDAGVLLRDGKVVEVGAGLQAPAGVTTIDARGRWVTPGLIDPHSHVGDYPAPITSQTGASTMIATIETSLSNVDSALARLSSGAKKFSIQADFVQKLSDTLTAGIGNLVDADMAKESALLQSLQVRQQLGVQALSIANSAPSITLSLFR